MPTNDVRKQADQPGTVVEAAGSGRQDFVLLSDDEAELVHCVAEGLDLEAIAERTGLDRPAVLNRLRALSLRLAREHEGRPTSPRQVRQAFRDS